MNPSRRFFLTLFACCLTFATAWTFGPHESKVNDAQNNAIQSVLLGKSNVKSALDTAVSDANSALSGG